MTDIKNAKRTYPAAGIGAIVCSRGNLPLAELDYKTTVDGLAAETEITQTFSNCHAHVIEATYIFPLPENGAVTRCVMKIGTRVVEAVLRERQQARQEYQQAIEDGHRAALLEEDRSETFSLQLGNLAPDDIVQVALTLVTPLHVAGGEATLRLPLVVAPRYVPGIPLDGRSVGNGVSVDTDQSPDASRISPPVLLEGFPNPVRLAIQVQLDPKLIATESSESEAKDNRWFNKLSSPLFPISVFDRQPHTIKLDPLQRADSDFVLRFPIVGDEVRTIARAESLSGSPDSAVAVTIVPPANFETTTRARDILFVLDRSGSMGGWKIDAAVRATVRLIESLGPNDRFHVIAFDLSIERPGGVPETWIEATDENRWQVVRWLATIRARGGTEMGPALITALRQFEQPQGDKIDSALPRSKSIVLVTDGQVSAEDSILASIARFNPRSRPRLFAIGVDSCVNMGILKKLADATGGSTELVESRERLDVVFARLADEIGNPWLTNMSFELRNDKDCRDIGSEFFPANVSSMYYDRPATFYARLPEFKEANVASEIQISGKLSDGSDWQTSIAVESVSSGPIPAMWGRHAVRSMEDKFVMTGSSDTALQRRIVTTSLLANVLCRFTAYIAVDNEEKIVGHQQSETIVQPVEAPRKREVCDINSTILCNRVDVSKNKRGASYLIPESVARENLVMPTGERDGKLEVRMQDPNDLDTIEKLRFILNKDIVVTPADRDEIVDEINLSYGQTEGESADSILQEFTDAAIDFTETEELKLSGPVDADASPVVRLLSAIFDEALQLRASHIVLMSGDGGITVYYVIDGTVVLRDSLESRLRTSVMRRLKVLGGIDLVRRDVPQFGEIKIATATLHTEIFVFITPTNDGASAVLRMNHIENMLDRSNYPEPIMKLRAAVQASSGSNVSRDTADAVTAFERMLRD